jgi:hypothetical protein
MISFRKLGKNPIVYDFPIEFNCKNLYMGSKEGATFSTSIPISSKEWRVKFGRIPEVRVKVEKAKTIFNIIDDYSQKYIVEISNEHQSIIEGAILSAIDDDLLRGNF